jgi:YkoY family integral membrane protein
MYELIKQIINNPVSTLMIIGNLILVESLLSVDNAAVLATMVMALPARERAKALKYGIFGAYLCRGLCLFLAAFLIKIWWLKALGGMYLVYLFIHWLWKKQQKTLGGPHKADNRLYKLMAGRMGAFWAAVISVELMDLAFSMDNVFAAVAFSSNILIILCGVFIGILAMRFVAQGFVKLMERYSFLETCAYTVIGLLGIKLALSFYQHFYPKSALSGLIDNRNTDWVTSAVTISIFMLPLLTSMLFNFPQRKDIEAKKEISQKR